MRTNAIIGAWLSGFVFAVGAMCFSHGGWKFLLAGVVCVVLSYVLLMLPRK
jgi:hypothetical protein